MRSTLTIEDRLADALKEAAHRSGKSFKQQVNETLRAGLSAGMLEKQRKRYRTKPVRMGGVLRGYDLDKALQLADQFENDEIVRKLDLRK